ncbi:MAG TPA: phosphodiester glycosidase family protein [Thermoanaerobaculia bacterium]
MRRARPLLLAFLVAQPALLFAAVSSPFRADATMKVAPGVVHERGSIVTTTAGRQAVYVARIEVAQPALRVEASLANGKVAAAEPVTEQANRENREGHRAVVAINGNYFDPNQAPFGVQVEDGHLVAFGPKPEPSFGITPERRAMIGNAGVSASVCRVDGICTPLARLNLTRTMGEGTGELVLYTNRFGDTTGTDDSGTEVVLSGAPLPLPVKGSFEATVKRVRSHSGATHLDSTDVVLSGSGTAAKFLDLLPDGAHVAITLAITSGWENVAQALSGQNVLVREGALAIDPYVHGFADVVNPRSAIGITAKGEVLVFAVDGRQPGYSIGVTLDELGEVMLAEGVVSGINLDGGGSTTLAIRLPGTDGVTMVNRGSDGFERPVGNSLAVYSTAPTGPLALLAIRPGSASVLIGSHIDYTALGQDASYNPARLPQPAKWELSGNIGSIDASGRFSAGQAGEGTIKASIDEVKGSTPVSVVGSLASLDIRPSPVIVGSDATQTFALTGHDAEGHSVFVDAAAAEWRGSPAIGRFASPGTLRAASSGRGTVSASAGGAVATSRIEIGKAPVVLDDFESTNGLKISATRSAANFSRAMRPDPVRRGTSSLRLAYDLRNQRGISAAGIRWDPSREIDSRPRRIGIWVFGDGSHHDLRGNYRDGTGALKIVNFTTTPGSLLSTCNRRRGGIDWIGWKYIEVPIPRDAVVPLQWERIYLVETNDRCDNASTLYFDDLRAVYLEASEDTTGPLITAFVPPPNSVIEDGRPEIGASIKDEASGVEASSIRLLVDGVQVPATFDAVSGRARYTPSQPLPPGSHRVHLEADDRAGNPAQPFAEWGFTVK